MRTTLEFGVGNKPLIHQIQHIFRKMFWCILAEKNIYKPKEVANLLTCLLAAFCCRFHVSMRCEQYNTMRVVSLRLFHLNSFQWPVEEKLSSISSINLCHRNVFFVSFFLSHESSPEVLLTLRWVWHCLTLSLLSNPMKSPPVSTSWLPEAVCGFHPKPNCSYWRFKSLTSGHK